MELSDETAKAFKVVESLNLEVTEIGESSALLKWTSVDTSEDLLACISVLSKSLTDFGFVVLCAKTFNKVAKTKSLEYRLTDLKPNTEYEFRVHAMMEEPADIIGASDNLSFSTKGPK